MQQVRRRRKIQSREATITARFLPEVKQKVKALAAQRKMSVSRLVEELVCQGIKDATLPEGNR